MPVDATALKHLAARIKRQTTNRDIIELCDGILSLSGTCSACDARRQAKTNSQRKWRERARADSRAV